MSPRKVSNELHNNEGKTRPGSKGFTHMAIQFGQFLAHDITLTPEGGSLDFWQIDVLISHVTNHFTELECCNPTVLLKDLTALPSTRRCFNIDVKHDPEFKGINDCFPFTR